jgi:uncharacterized protein YrrD
MTKNMELKEGAGVFTPGGKQVGKVNRFVLHPATNEVTHIVVQKGWLLPEDKVVPLRMVDSATKEKVVLTKDVDDFDALPLFEEIHYIRALDDEDPSYYWYPPEGYVGYPAYELDYYPWLPVETTRNIPDDTVPLKEGSKVISLDGKHVGDLERLFVEPSLNRATHFIIAQGLLFKDRKLIPTYWVKSVEEDKVNLVVSSHFLESLPSYVERVSMK